MRHGTIATQNPSTQTLARLSYPSLSLCNPFSLPAHARSPPCTPQSGRAERRPFQAAWLAAPASRQTRRHQTLGSVQHGNGSLPPDTPEQDGCRPHVVECLLLNLVTDRNNREHDAKNWGSKDCTALTVVDVLQFSRQFQVAVQEFASLTSCPDAPLLPPAFSRLGRATVRKLCAQSFCKNDERSKRVAS